MSYDDWCRFASQNLQKRNSKKYHLFHEFDKMNEIKEYKQLTTISTFDWDILTEASIDVLDKMLNADWNFIRIWDEIIAKNQIKKIWIKKVDTIENFILQFPREIQQKLRERDKQKYERLWKHFESIQEIQNYITNNNLL